MLKLVYGKSGTGKSTYLYQSIKENFEKEKIFLIVPEQSNLRAEQKLFEYLKTTSIFNVQVLTLSRLAVRVLEEIGGDNVATLNHSSKAMVIYDILAKEKDNLHFLGKSDKNIEIISNMITEFKKHNITLDVLDYVEVDDTLTRLKLQDMKRIYQKYSDKLQGNFIDENDVLTKICPKILESSIFENALVYIDDFLGFTPQEYHVFENILRKAENVTVTIPADTLERGEQETDIFYFNKIFASKLEEIAEKNEVEIETIELRDNKRIFSKDLKYLEHAFCSSAPVPLYQETPENLRLFLANTSYSELEFVANEILKLVKEENYHYNEIAVVSGDLENYNLEAKVIFNKYQIPIFIDDKKDLNQNLLIKYVLAVLDIFAKNWSFETVFNYIKLGMMSEISEEEMNLLENYCRKWGIKNYKWFKPFAIEPKNNIQDRLEEIRKLIVEPLISLKENISNHKTAGEITKQIYEFVLNNNIPEILNEKLSKINHIEMTNEYNTSYKIFIDVLDNIVAIFRNQKMTFEEYKNLIQVGFSESEVGTIPATQDQVVIGDSKRSRNSNIKVCFIVGINDGFFPTINKFEGFFNDTDREHLKEAGMELAKTSLEAMYENNFEIYNILGTPSQKLYLSYCSQNKDGKSLRPSILIKKIKRLFPMLEESSDIIQKDYVVTNQEATFDDSIAVYHNFLNGEKLTDEWKTVLNYYQKKEKKKFSRIIDAENYTNVAETLSKKNIEKLYGKKFKGSVSKLEQYRNCPFSFYLKYGLKLREKEEFQIQSINTGTFMHEVIDHFFEKIEELEISVKDLTEEKIKEIVSEIIEALLNTSEFYVLSSTSKFRTLTRRLKKVVLESIQYIVYTLNSSNFEIYGHEIEFGNTNQFKPIVMELEGGKRVQIEGKIDRLDIGKLDDKTYVRIIDYKSRIQSLDMKKLEAGLQIQLITYLDAVCKQENFEPAGILYSGLIDSKLKLASGKMDLEKEEVEAAIRKNFKMNGVVLADYQVVKMMDNHLNNGVTSDIIPVGITNKGAFDSRRSKILTQEEFSGLQVKVNNIIKEISSEILDGKIDIRPYSYKDKTGCTYCEYSSICRFNPNSKENYYYYIS
ncbi:MAG: exodeoxyribonuclease V subunit gamma [Clostridia bacterium]|nr:exodeoxyribonuclease V subunit gamma [Clostridia bacterium]